MAQDSNLVYIVSVRVNEDDAQCATYTFPTIEARNQIVLELLEKDPSVELTTFSITHEYFEKQFGTPLELNYFH